MAPFENIPYSELSNKSQFETLLAEISTLFISLPADQISRKIEDVQGRICELLDLDRSTLWQFLEQEPGILRLTHIHQPPDSLPPADRMNANDFFPWIMQKMKDGETVTISKMTDLPAEADRDRESFIFYGAKSGIYVPLSVGQGLLFGVLTFAAMREERDWTERVVQGVTLLAQVFSNALARQQAEMALRESESRLILATNAVGAGLWSVELNTGSVWVSGKTRDLFHFSPNEKLNTESFFNVIHPEDCERVNQAVQQAIHSGASFLCEYRIVLPDGNIRWIGARGQHHPGSAEESDRLLGVSFDISARKQMEEQLKERLDEIEDLKQRFEQMNIYLKEEVKLLTEHSSGILGQSATIKNILTQAEQVAGTDSTVLLLGETGTGKGLLAKAIHGMSLRKDQQLVTVNCSSLPPSLIENELFGREKGAYTGAMTKMVGRFELADGSTLFLDEIAELPLDLQSKLLRVLEEGILERLGSTKSLHVNVRIIAATNRDLQQEVENGKFRQDLFYRLSVFPILIPPLRERSEDIPLMVRAFVREFQKRLGRQIERIPNKTMQDLISYPWLGNVRELRNVIERGMILSKDKTLVVHLPTNASSETDVTGNLEDMMRRQILTVLKNTHWRVAGRGGAAEILGLKRSTLYSKMKKLGIHRSNS
ncbi:MAG: sigma 54-interacting transcriptional regulator [Proteobacteria bacterium]|nr:sigma 54-interacting transcriptional regulator [Pseudomonadota bacterium]MBU1419073.1 sigma 54-interacting transcriptional regulator [Pseudomonadota bacterium]